MTLLERILRGVGRVLEVLMKGAGLVTAVDELLIDPTHASGPKVLLSGILLMGGQASKDFLLGLADRLLAQGGHHSGPPASGPPVDEIERGGSK